MLIIMLCAIMLSVQIAEWHYAERQNAEWHYAERHSSRCHGAISAMLFCVGRQSS